MSGESNRPRSDSIKRSRSDPMQNLRIALDWTPNTNHTPILLALAHSHYASAGLHVQIISPASDDYSITPATKLARSEVDIALCPSESIISHRYSSHRAPLKAIATLLAKDASAIAVLSSSDITRPRQLDGKRYASYDARFEDATVRAMIRADGGEGGFEIVKPPKFGIWGALMDGSADATWIFPPWEGVEAEQRGQEVRCFRLEEYGVPYGLSPVLAVNGDMMGDPGKSEVLRRFLAATKKGAEDIVRDMEGAVKAMELAVPENEKGLVRESLRILADGGFFGESGKWGEMDGRKWEDWVGWLRQQGLLDGIEVDAGDLYDVKYLS